MLQNYLKIAWRGIVREKGYAFINIAGLAVGMAAAMLIFLWIQNELTFDRFYPKTKRLFQVYNRDVIGGEPQVWDATPAPLAAALLRDYPEVEDAARYRSTNLLLAANNKFFNVEGSFADPAFLNLFDFEVLTGNPRNALAGNSNIVITKSLAEKLFGTTDVLGKAIRIERKDNLVITAVLDNIPSNSRFQTLEYVLPWDYSVALGWTNDNWNNNNYYTYVLLDPKANPVAVNEKIKHTTVSHLRGIMEDPSHREIFLNPADKWHLYSKEEHGQLVDGRIVTVRLFGVIAAFILLIACVNFINLSTARSGRRAKEVGIRKVAGAPRVTLIFQFISESIILSFLSGVAAFAIVWALIPSFNTLVNTQLSPDFSSISFLLPALAFVLFTGLLAGSYPAFFLANFQPVKVMKGTYRAEKAGFSPRKGLVVLQFTFAIILIISTLIIKQQINHAQNRNNRNSGYDKDNLVFSYLQGELAGHYAPVQQELLSSGAVSSISKSIGPITQLNTRQWGVSWPGSTQKDKDQEFVPFGTDFDFLKTNGVKLAAGREIDIRKYPSDSLALMLNESAVRAMRLDDPIGLKVKSSGKEWNVVGVVKDFIYASPYDNINPVLVYGPARDLPWTSMRLNPANSVAKNLEIVRAIFKKYNPEYPFEYTFADDSYQVKFAEEQRTGKLTEIFTGLTIFISCLGLFGLAAFSAKQRTKEIGVRKVLGASVTSIVQMLSTEFVKLVLIAFLLASPIAWYAMDQWLRDYQYRIMIEWYVFAATLLLTVLLVLATVSFQAIKAALMNPVRSLKVD